MKNKFLFPLILFLSFSVQANSVVSTENMPNTNIDFWQEQFKNNKEYNINLNILNGVADYIPNWTKFITDETN